MQAAPRKKFFLLKQITDIMAYFIVIVFYFIVLASKCSGFKICHKNEIILYWSALILPYLKMQHFSYDFTKWFLDTF